MSTDYARCDGCNRAIPHDEPPRTAETHDDDDSFTLYYDCDASYDATVDVPSGHGQHRQRTEHVDSCSDGTSVTFAPTHLRNHTTETTYDLRTTTLSGVDALAAHHLHEQYRALPPLSPESLNTELADRLVTADGPGEPGGIALHITNVYDLNGTDHDVSLYWTTV
jgi:hypothetical protein